MEYPDYVIKKLEVISERIQKPMNELKKEYESFFDDLVEDAQLPTDEERHRYAKAYFWNKYALRPQTKPFDIIPIGMDSVRKSKKDGMLNTSVFALDMKGKLRRISLKGDVCNDAKNLTFFSMYKGVELGTFRNSNDLSGDDRAEFNEPHKVDMSPETMIDTLGFDEVVLVSILSGENLSNVGSDGYVDKTDWKCIRGMIQRQTQSQPDSDSEWGVYTVVDESLDPEKMEPEITPSGQILPPGFSVWISPSLMNYPPLSQCKFLGTTQKDKKSGKISMNCYCVVPVYVQKREEKEE